MGKKVVRLQERAAYDQLEQMREYIDIFLPFEGPLSSNFLIFYHEKSFNLHAITLMISSIPFAFSKLIFCFFSVCQLGGGTRVKQTNCVCV